CSSGADNTEYYIRTSFKGLPYRLGPQTHQCQFCGALRWGEERTKANIRRGEETYSNCCQQGSVMLPWGEFEGPTVPLSLQMLYTGEDE
ncbi:hypothetical protein DFH28DRAFT_877453, partial [Melampsora americana]